jgi:hypothetical protein
MRTPQTLVSIVAAYGDQDVISTELRLMAGRWPTDPLAPATIWRDTAPPERVLELHRLIARDENTLRFETYGGSWSLPEAVDPLLFYSWWTPDQLDVAQSTDLTWTKTIYNGRDHDHCLLTWEKIRRGDIAFVSDGGWITEDSYRRYIQNDELRLRASE